jgi:hypothetical protein
MKDNTLYTTRGLKFHTMYAVNGKIGNVKGFYFDEKKWKIRYLLSDAGDRPDRSNVLISTMAIGTIQPAEKSMYVELTLQQIENSPPIRKHQPISRQFEIEYYSYYGWPPYWEKNLLPVSQRNNKRDTNIKDQVDTVVMHPMFTHLHNTDELSGCVIAARDSVSGYLEDFILDTRYWKIHYLQVNTQHECRNKQVLISPGWIERLDLSTRTIHIDLPSHLVMRAPAFDSAQAITHKYEARLLRHFGNPLYWRRNNG